MIAFLLYTFVALFGNACITKILHISIQPGQWLDALLGWQKRLQRWDMQGKVFLAKAGGYCEVCFSHLAAVMGYWCYNFFMHAVLNQWISSHISNVFVLLLINIIWYLLYVSIATNLGLYFIVKLFDHENES